MVMPAAEADPGLISAIYDAALDAGRWPDVLRMLATELNDASLRVAIDQTPTTDDFPASVGALSDCGRKRGRAASLTQAQRVRISALAPHLRRALQLNRSIGDLQIACGLACEALDRFRHGIVVVDSGARILLANQAAEAILADPAGVIWRDRQRLAARRPTDVAALLRLIGMAALEGSGGSCVLLKERRPAAVVLVMPAGGAPETLHARVLHAVVMIKDLAGAAKRASTAFGRYFALTPAQMALADEIVRGDGVRAAARRLRISYGTARAHLLQIFQKTGARRQTELVRLMSEWDDGITPSAGARNARVPVSAPERK